MIAENGGSEGGCDEGQQNNATGGYLGQCVHSIKSQRLRTMCMCIGPYGGGLSVDPRLFLITPLRLRAASGEVKRLAKGK